MKKYNVIKVMFLQQLLHLSWLAYGMEKGSDYTQISRIVRRLEQQYESIEDKEEQSELEAFKDIIPIYDMMEEFDKDSADKYYCNEFDGFQLVEKQRVEREIKRLKRFDEIKREVEKEGVTEKDRALNIWKKTEEEIINSKISVKMNVYEEKEGLTQEAINLQKIAYKAYIKEQEREKEKERILRELVDIQRQQVTEEQRNLKEIAYLEYMETSINAIRKIKPEKITEEQKSELQLMDIMTILVIGELKEFTEVRKLDLKTKELVKTFILEKKKKGEHKEFTEERRNAQKLAFAEVSKLCHETLPFRSSGNERKALIEKQKMLQTLFHAEEFLDEERRRIEQELPTEQKNKYKFQLHQQEELKNLEKIERFIDEQRKEIEFLIQEELIEKQKLLERLSFIELLCHKEVRLAPSIDEKGMSKSKELQELEKKEKIQKDFEITTIIDKLLQENTLVKTLIDQETQKLIDEEWPEQESSVKKEAIFVKEEVITIQKELQKLAYAKAFITEEKQQLNELKKEYGSQYKLYKQSYIEDQVVLEKLIDHQKQKMESSIKKELTEKQKKLYALGFIETMINEKRQAAKLREILKIKRISQICQEARCEKWCLSTYNKAIAVTQTHENTIVKKLGEEGYLDVSRKLGIPWAIKVEGKVGCLCDADKYLEDSDLDFESELGFEYLETREKTKKKKYPIVTHSDATFVAQKREQKILKKTILEQEILEKEIEEFENLTRSCEQQIDNLDRLFQQCIQKIKQEECLQKKDLESVISIDLKINEIKETIKKNRVSKFVPSWRVATSLFFANALMKDKEKKEKRNKRSKSKSREEIIEDAKRIKDILDNMLK